MWAINITNCGPCGGAACFWNEIESIDGDANSTGCHFAFVQMVHVVVVVGAIGGIGRKNFTDEGSGGVKSTSEAVGCGLWVADGAQVTG